MAVEIVFSDAPPLKIPLTISLSRGDFPSTHLRVDPRFTSPSPEEQERIRAERALIDEIYAAGRSSWLGEGGFTRPLQGSVSSPFGAKRLFNDIIHSRHRGVDLRSPPGTPVEASNAGFVVFTGSLFYAGKTVIIDHGMDLFTLYCHLSETVVSRGEFVGRGSLIGRVGATGRATGPHLHWGARLAGVNVDPLSLLDLPLEGESFQISAE